MVTTNIVIEIQFKPKNETTWYRLPGPDFGSLDSAMRFMDEGEKQKKYECEYRIARRETTETYYRVL